MRACTDQSAVAEIEHTHRPASTIAAVVLFPVLAGCVVPGEPMKAGATHEDFVHDAASCRVQAMMSAPQTTELVPDPYVVTRTTRECLQARGWTLPPGVVLPL
jgi:hypothetical protein